MKKISILALHLGYKKIKKCVVNLANTLCKKYNVEIAVCYRLYDKSVFELDKKVKVIYLNDDLKPNHETLRSSLKSKNPIRIVKELSFSAKVLHYRKKTMVQYIRNTDN